MSRRRDSLTRSWSPTGGFGQGLPWPFRHLRGGSQRLPAENREMKRKIRMKTV